MYTHYHRYADGTSEINGINLKSIPRGLRYIYDIMYNAYRLYYTHDDQYVTNLDKLNGEEPALTPITINPPPNKFYVVNTLDRTQTEQQYITDGIKSNNIYIEYVKAYTSVSRTRRIDISSFLIWSRQL